jgi:pimeloyl-ACP methyl ester carboxylesterase
MHPRVLKNADETNERLFGVAPGGMRPTSLMSSALALQPKRNMPGIWADGSCFSKVIPALQAEGHEVIAAQYSLDTVAGDVAMVKRTLGRVSSPATLVGHSYGGAVITEA